MVTGLQVMENKWTSSLKLNVVWRKNWCEGEGKVFRFGHLNIFKHLYLPKPIDMSRLGPSRSVAMPLIKRNKA